MVQRSLTWARDTWALVGLAVRIAYDCGLPEDGDGQGLSAFDAEMRRRLWWQIMILEWRASDERGSGPLLSQDAFNTALPCNLNDEDFDTDSQHPLIPQPEPTDMTLGLLSMDAVRAAQEIKHRSMANEDSAMLQQEREEPVRSYARRFESVYLANCDFDMIKVKASSSMGYYWIYKLWLLLYYPLNSQIPSQSTDHGLQLAMMLLRFNDLLEHHSTSSNIAWYCRSYIPWHAVAVALIELCREPLGKRANRAWDFINSRFDEWSIRYSDNKVRIVWDRIKELLKRARAIRRNAQEPGTESKTLDASALDDWYAMETNLWQENGGENSGGFNPHVFGDFGLFNEPTNLNFSSVTADRMDSLAASHTQTTLPQRPDVWSEFVLKMRTPVRSED